MNGKKVEILLNTPIFVPVRDSEEKEKKEPVFKILGQAELMGDAGLLVTVTRLEGFKGQEIATPYPKLFIPLHKIDHVFVIS